MRKNRINDRYYQYRRHNKNLLMVHLIFITKYRKQLLMGDINNDIKQLIFNCRESHQWYIKKMETDKDHIHLLLQFKPTDSISNIVATVKAYTTYHIWRLHHDILINHFWKERTFWSDGYFCCTIGNISVETVSKYIENQG